MSARTGSVREALIAAALELLAGDGEPDALSLREVARRVGVSHPAAYHHFAGKESLLAAVAAEGFKRLDAAMAAAADGFAEDQALPRFEALGIAYVRFAIAHPRLFRHMFRRGALGPEDVELLRQAASHSFMRVLLATQGIRPDLGPDEAMDLTLLAWTAMHGTVMLWLDGPLAVWTGNPDVELTARRIAAQVLRRLLAP